jgi:hypothetical protein
MCRVRQAGAMSECAGRPAGLPKPGLRATAGAEGQGPALRRSGHEVRPGARPAAPPGLTLDTVGGRTTGRHPPASCIRCRHWLSRCLTTRHALPHALVQGPAPVSEWRHLTAAPDPGIRLPRTIPVTSMARRSPMALPAPPYYRVPAARQGQPAARARPMLSHRPLNSVGTQPTGFSTPAVPRSGGAAVARPMRDNGISLAACSPGERIQSAAANDPERQRQWPNPRPRRVRNGNPEGQTRGPEGAGTARANAKPPAATGRNGKRKGQLNRPRTLRSGTERASSRIPGGAPCFAVSPSRLDAANRPNGLPCSGLLADRRSGSRGRLQDAQSAWQPRRLDGAALPYDELGVESACCLDRLQDVDHVAR